VDYTNRWFNCQAALTDLKVRPDGHQTNCF
jgi:hypothetical protein